MLTAMKEGGNKKFTLLEKTKVTFKAAIKKSKLGRMKKGTG
jgi:hypothetical protein